MKSQAINTTQMTMIRPNNLNRITCVLVASYLTELKKYWNIQPEKQILKRGFDLILFKIPTFNLFIITSRKHVCMSVTNRKACKQSKLLLPTWFTIAGTTIHSYLSILPLTCSMWPVNVSLSTPLAKSHICSNERLSKKVS